MPLFRSTVKSPREVVGVLREALQYLAQHHSGTAAGGGIAPAQKWPAKKQQSSQKRRVSVLQRKHEREPGGEFDSTKTAAEECSKLLVVLKDILLPSVADNAAGASVRSSGGSAANLQQQQVDETVKLCYESDILLYLVRGSVLEELPSPEARRDVVRIFRYFLERQTDSTVKYIIKHQELLSILITNYDSGKAQVVAHSGLMLRACTRYKSLVWITLLLRSSDALQFFDFMQAKQFEVLADAFVTFKELLKHEDLTGKFLEENCDEVFQRLCEILSSDFYITKHVSLEWTEQLLEESSSMREYFHGSTMALKTVMTLLGSDPSVSIRFKALDLLQGFLAVEEKEREVNEILLTNRDKLEALTAELLTKFDEDKKYCPEPGRSFLLTTLRDPDMRPAHSEVLNERDCEDGGGEEAHFDSQEVSLIEPPSAGQSTHSEHDQPSTGEQLPPPHQQPLLDNQNDGVKEEESKKSEGAERDKEKEDHPSTGRENSTDNQQTGPTADEGVQLTEHSQKEEERLDGHVKKEDPLIPDCNEKDKLPLENTEKVNQPDHPWEEPISHQTKKDEDSTSPPPKEDKQLLDRHEGSKPPVELTTAEEQVEHTHREKQQLVVTDDGMGGGGVEGELPLVRDEQEDKPATDLPGDLPPPPSLPEEGTPCDSPNEKEPLATPSPCEQEVVQPEEKSGPPSLSTQPEDEIAQPGVNKNGKMTPLNPFLEDGGDIQLNPFEGEDGGKTGLNPFLDYSGGSEETLTRQLEPDEPTPPVMGGQSMPDAASVLNQLEKLQSVQVPPPEIPAEQLKAFLSPTNPDLEIRLDEEGLAPLLHSESDSSLEEPGTLEEPENDSSKELDMTKLSSSDHQDNGGSPHTHQEQM